MARLVDQLTEAKIRGLTTIGLHPDGHGLYLQIRALVADGIDPIEDAKAKAAVPVAPKANSSLAFEEAAEAYMADRLKRLRSETHRHQWRQPLEDYAYPIIGNMPVAEIETSAVLTVLTPIWESKCETASRLRGRIERILARCTVEGVTHCI